MAGEWWRRNLGDLAELHKQQVNPAKYPKQLFQHFSLPAFDDGQSPVVELGARIESQKFSVPPTAILVSKLNPRIPRVWEPHVADDGSAVASTEYLVLVPKKGTNRRFLKYACLSPMIRSELEARATGTSGSHQRVRPEDALAIEVDIPKDESEQRAIAHILGTLDDKIELNRWMNCTLETMARALFKSWFVDFDPVRAKVEGCDTGLPQEIADQFPDSFEDTERGEVPKGWRGGSLGEVADNPRRGIQPEAITPETPYIGLEHMPRRCIALSDWGHPEALESNKYEFRQGEMLFGKLRPYFHKVGVAAVNGVCSTDIVVVTPKMHEWFGYVLGHISSTDFVEYTNAGSTGTKMPRTSWHEMARFSVTIPPTTLAARYTKMIQPIVERIAVNIHESRTLVAQRDTLLPKLLSGELRVKDAERIVERSL